MMSTRFTIIQTIRNSVMKSMYNNINRDLYEFVDLSHGNISENVYRGMQISIWNSVDQSVKRFIDNRIYGKNH